MNKIIVVDDNELELEVMGNILEQGGFDVIKLCSSDDVAKIVAAIQPVCVVLDVMMPAKSGAEVYKELKTMPITEDIPVLFVTSCSSVDSEIANLNLTKYDLLQKPIQMQRLLTRVQEKGIACQIQSRMEAMQNRMRGLVKTMQIQENVH